MPQVGARAAPKRECVCAVCCVLCVLCAVCVVCAVCCVPVEVATPLGGGPWQWPCGGPWRWLRRRVGARRGGRRSALVVVELIGSSRNLVELISTSLGLVELMELIGSRNLVQFIGTSRGLVEFISVGASWSSSAPVGTWCSSAPARAL